MSFIECVPAVSPAFYYPCGGDFLCICREKLSVKYVFVQINITSNIMNAANIISSVENSPFFTLSGTPKVSLEGLKITILPRKDGPLVECAE